MLEGLRWQFFEAFLQSHRGAILELFRKILPGATQIGLGITPEFSIKWDFSPSIFSTGSSIMAFPPFDSTEAVAIRVRNSFHWEWKVPSRPPTPLPKDYLSLCPDFDRATAEEVAQGANIPEIVQATFYSMVVNVVVEHNVICNFSASIIMGMLEALR
ncbi:hypothetical protein Cgig2_026028 [Carnegiea gigantea]|uniref:Uncharacterized protein n=1 Tax=Carnegiea gigantea TaxID=171969 RepID=A0A9Q1KMY7_9CARY|nr:hypothetical protein Cgig2_026028 [Carnegiea gigantea]